MADNHSKEVRSMNMSHIRSKGTKPEEIVRKFLFSQGFRYRKMFVAYLAVLTLSFLVLYCYFCKWMFLA